MTRRRIAEWIVPQRDAGDVQDIELRGGELTHAKEHSGHADGGEGEGANIQHPTPNIQHPVFHFESHNREMGAGFLGEHDFKMFLGSVLDG